ncbi:MAG: TIGR03067 domain-containing protein [Pirellulales bacterium]|nr:TIGR03067 domain-containing protein [Pirellulales bacterium]
MPTVTCPDRETLRRYSLGLLSDEQSNEIAEHLESCPDCQATIVNLGDATDTLVGRLRTPTENDSCLAEPQFQSALAEAMEMPPAEPTAILQTLGEYHLLETLGRGGMGRVYKALHTKLDRIVAIKILPHARSDDPRAISRFEREMKAVGRLTHPNIVQAFDAREIDGTPVLIMEYVAGLDLAAIVRHVGPLPIADACELVRQTAAALQCAHEHGLVHRDVKPSNIMLNRSGEVKLLDLGLARFYAEAAVGEEMTGVGQAMGTADYMAPEQAADSRTVDIRADLYSLGCTLYKLLSGRAPFGGPDYRGTLDKLNAHVHQAPTPIRQINPEVPEGIEKILDRLLAKNPDDRFTTPNEVAEAVKPFATSSDLLDLIEYAESVPDRSAALPAAIPSPQPATASRGWKHFVKQFLLLLLVGGFGFALGIIIRIKKDGREATVEVPSGSLAQVHEDGQVTIQLPDSTKSAGTSSDAQKDDFELWCKQLEQKQKVLLGYILKKDAKSALAFLKRMEEDLDHLLSLSGSSPVESQIKAMRKKMDELQWALEREDWAYFYVLMHGPKESTDQNMKPAGGKTSPRHDPLTDLLGQKFTPYTGGSPLTVPRTAKITRGDIKATITATGTLEPEEVVEVSAGVAGKVVSLAADPRGETTSPLPSGEGPGVRAAENYKGKTIDYGTPVTKGMVLARLDDESYRLRVQEAKIKLESAQDELKMQTVANQKVPATVPQASIRKLEAAVQLAKIALKQAELALSRTRILSPVDGVVVVRRVNVGQKVDDAKILFRIAKGSKKVQSLQLTSWTGGPEIREITAGMPVRLTADSLPGKVFMGKVERAGPHSPLLLRPLADDPELLELPPGLPVKLQFEVVHRNVLRVPNEAIRDKTFAPTETFGSLEKINLDRRIEIIKASLGLSNHEYTEVSGPNVKEGMEVVVRPGAPPIDLPPPAVYPTTHDVSAVNPAAELRALQGQWKVVRVEKGKDGDDAWGAIVGVESPCAPINPATTFRVEFNDQYDPPMQFRSPEPITNTAMCRQGFSYRIDPTASPKTIDLLADNNATYPEGRPAALGIYEIDGNRLKIRLSRYLPEVKSEQRPRNFTVDPQSGDLLFVLERHNPSQDEKAIQGTWTLSGQIEDGRPVPEKQLSPQQCQISSYYLYIMEWQKLTGNTQGVPKTHLSGDYTLDESKQPKRITIFSWDSLTLKREDFHGIYQFDGDRLQIAYRKNGPAPEKFESAPGSGVTLLKLTRSQPNAETPSTFPLQTQQVQPPTAPAVNPAAELKALQGPWKVVRVEKGKNADDAPQGSWRSLGFDPRVPVTFEKNYFEAPQIESGYTQSLFFRINPLSKPKTIDFREQAEVPNNGELIAQGIYQFQDDQLKICLAEYSPSLQTDQRPKRFEADPQSADVLLTLERFHPVGDERRIQGRWSLMSHLENGKTIAKKATGSKMLHFTNAAVIPVYTGDVALGDLPKSLPSNTVWIYLLDPAAKPKTITIVGRSLFEGGKQELNGIYQFEGDRLKIAFRKDSAPPEKFESPPGSHVTLLTLERLQPKTYAPTQPTRIQSPAGAKADGKPQEQ